MPGFNSALQASIRCSHWSKALVPSVSGTTLRTLSSDGLMKNPLNLQVKRVSIVMLDLASHRRVFGYTYIDIYNVIIIFNMYTPTSSSSNLKHLDIRSCLYDAFFCNHDIAVTHLSKFTICEVFLKCI